MGTESVPLILVVDDDQIVRESLKDMLIGGGYRVELAEQGLEALQKINERHPDLVLLDLVLPDLDGLEICRQIKSNEAPTFLPVVILTAQDDIENRMRGLKVGADDYLTKPPNPQELLARIDALLRIKRLQDQIALSKRQMESDWVTDPKTGLYNSRFFTIRLADEFARAERYSEPLSCIALNLDLLADVFQVHGREGTEHVVQELAEILRKGIRDFDVLVRVNEERFMILLPRTHFTGSLAVATRILQQVQVHHFQWQNEEICVQTSVGVSFFPNKDVDSAEDLVSQAESALKKAQDAGGGQICLFQHTAYFYRPDMGR